MLNPEFEDVLLRAVYGMDKAGLLDYCRLLVDEEEKMPELDPSAISPALAEPSVNDRLAKLVKRAELSALAPSTNNRNRVLLNELSFTIVALAQRVVELQAEMAEKPRIVIP